MANNTRTTFDQTKNYKQVLYQKGRRVVDSEVNEQQQIIAADLSGSVRDMNSALVETVATGFKPLVAVGDSWSCTTPGNNSLYIDPGTAGGVAYVDGVRVILSAALNTGYTPAVVSALNEEWGVVYVDFVLAEITENEDPSLAHPQIGTQALRKKLVATAGCARVTALAGTAGFVNAMAALPAFPAGGSGSLLTGGTARLIVGRFFRPASSPATITAATNVLDMRASVAAERETEFVSHRMRQSTSGFPGRDGAITWNTTTQRLCFGVTTPESSVLSVSNGLETLTSEGVYHYLQQAPGVAWALAGAGDLDGTPIMPDAGGFLVQTGDALGWMSDGTNASVQTSFRRKGATIKTYHLDASPTFTTPQLSVQRLVVRPQGDFTKDPNSRILCIRRDSDLVWSNGQVTRGSLNGSVFVALGEAPSPYDAVVGQSPESGGSVHLSRTDAIERAVHFRMKDAGVGSLGAGTSIRIFVKRGGYQFARGLRVWGLPSDDVDMTDDDYSVGARIFELHGEGAHATRLLFDNPVSAGRTNIAVMTITADEIHLKGLKFAQTLGTSTRPNSYFLLKARKVVVEDCIFENGPLRIEADNIVYRRNKEQWTAAQTFPVFPTYAVQAGPVPQHLHLVQPGGVASAGSWVLEDNTHIPGCVAGTSASVVLSLLTAPRVSYAVLRDSWQYADGMNSTPSVPAIHWDGRGGVGEISRCTFQGASGVAKAGNTTTITPVPFNGDYAGCPLVGLAAQPERIYAAGYLSVTRGVNVSTAELSVHHNVFDLTGVARSGTTPNTSRFCMWGAFMGVFNTLTAPGVVSYGNIDFSDNVLHMSPEEGWGAAGAAPQPALWGFWISPTFQDGVGTVTLRVENVNVYRNTMRLGHIVASKVWRSIRSGNLGAWPASSGFLTDSPALIGVQLKNAAVGGLSYGGRWANGIHVAENQLALALGSSSSGLPAGDVVTISDTFAHPNWTFFGVLLDAGHLFGTYSDFGTVIVATEDADFFPTNLAGPGITSGGLILGAQVHNNVIQHPSFLVAPGGLTNGIACIDVVGAHHPSICHNTLYMSHSTMNKTSGVRCIGTKRAMIHMNSGSAYVGVRCTGFDYAVFNSFRNAPVGVVGATESPTAAGFNIGAATGSNWNT